MNTEMGCGVPQVSVLGPTYFASWLHCLQGHIQISTATQLYLAVVVNLIVIKLNLLVKIKGRPLKVRTISPFLFLNSDENEIIHCSLKSKLILRYIFFLDGITQTCMT